MNVEIITIGDEILIGQIIDTNSAWMGQELNGRGFDVNRITSIRDTKEAIKNALDEALRRVDVVLITGGLGPTNDDVTKHTLAEYFNSKLVFNELVYKDVCDFLKGKVKDVNELNRQQAFVPENCEVIRNKVGTAPNMWFERKGKIVVSMPGVPSEMKAVMTEEILPRLDAKFETGYIIHQTVLTSGIGESILAEKLQDWEKLLPQYISLAYLPSPGRVKLRLTARVEDENIGKVKIKSLVSQLYPLIGEYIYGEEDKLPEEILGEMLLSKKSSISVAESCTGGRIGHLITSISGSSAYFNGGVIAYSNEVKMNLLGVKENLLMEYGAVSQEVVEQMALGVKQTLNSDYSIATSGIAGPTGGTKEKPVGTVWIAIAGPFGVESQKYFFGEIRDKNIQRASNTALVKLIRKLLINNI